MKSTLPLQASSAVEFLFRAIQKIVGATLFRARDLTLGLPDPALALRPSPSHFPEGAWSVTIVPFPFDPSPSSLWTLHRNGKVASCELRFVPLGHEVRMLRNGSLLMSRIFPTEDEAPAWAEDEQQRMLDTTGASRDSVGHHS